MIEKIILTDYLLQAFFFFSPKKICKVVPVEKNCSGVSLIMFPPHLCLAESKGNSGVMKDFPVFRHF